MIKKNCLKNIEKDKNYIFKKTIFFHQYKNKIFFFNHFELFFEKIFKNHDNKKIKKKKQYPHPFVKKEFLTRKDFVNGIFFLFFINNNLVSTNVIEKKTPNFFFYFDSTHEKKIENALEIKNEKNLFKFFFFKEKDLEIIEKISSSFCSSFLISFLVFLGISFSNRTSNKIELPESYSPNQITAYFKLRPEKIFIRLSQIFFEISKFILGLINDYIIFPKNNEPKTYYVNKNKFLNFILLFHHNIYFHSKLNIKPNSKNFFNFFKLIRIENIFQISQFRLEKKKKKSWQIKWDNKAKQLRETIANLSPAFIKLAQALITRPDVVSERIAKELQRLQDDMPFFSNEKAFEFIKQELGANPKQIFSEISNEPVAAASLGQVYKANLDGIKVAIKVQRPGLLEVIALDILLIRFIASLVQQIFKIRTDLVAIVDEYAQRLFEELDYRKESSNMIKFRSLYGYMEMIYIPRVFVEYSSKHVLVMEWVEGDRLIKNSSKSMQEEVSLIEIGVRCSLVQLLETGFLHCDPHGGNLIKTKDGRLAYLDFGLVSEIPETVRYSFISAILNLVNREYESLAKDFNGMALIHNDDLDKEISKISLAFFETFDKSLSNFDKFTFQDVTEKVFRLTMKFPFILPPYFLNNLRAIATLEGLALTADPNFKIADVVYPYIINKLLTNAAPQFQAALEDFLIDRNTLKPNWNRLEALLQDPEWTETFSDQSENLSDTVLNFIISPTGNFLKNFIIQSLFESFLTKFLLIFSFFTKKKKTEKISNYNNSNPKKVFANVEEIIFPNFSGSKIYNWNTFVLLFQSCVFSTIIFISEFIFKNFFFLFIYFFKKISSLLHFSKKSKI